jgi:hypothetical protein
MHVVESLSVRQNVDVDLVFVIHVLSCRRKVPKVIAIKLDLEILLQFVLKRHFVNIIYLLLLESGLTLNFLVLCRLQ